MICQIIFWWNHVTAVQPFLVQLFGCLHETRGGIWYSPPSVLYYNIPSLEPTMRFPGTLVFILHSRSATPSANDSWRASTWSPPSPPSSSLNILGEGYCQKNCLDVKFSTLQRSPDKSLSLNYISASIYDPTPKSHIWCSCCNQESQNVRLARANSSMEANEKASYHKTFWCVFPYFFSHFCRECFQITNTRSQGCREQWRRAASGCALVCVSQVDLGCFKPRSRCMVGFAISFRYLSIS